MKSLAETRKQAYQINPVAAELADFMYIYDKKLTRMWKMLRRDTGLDVDLLTFSIFMYRNAYDLIVEPNLN